MLLDVSLRRFVIAAIVAAAACAPAACTLLNPLDGFDDGASSDDGAAATDTNVSTSDSPTNPDVLTEAATDGGVDAAPSRYAAAVLEDAPLFYYRFGETNAAPARDEISGKTTAYSAGGVAFGAPGALAADPNTAITLDGVGQLSLSHPSEFDGLAPFSVEAWVSPSPNGNTLGLLVDHETWSGGRKGWLLRASRVDIGFERWDGVSTNNSTATAQAAAMGEWHHIVGTFDGTTNRLYVDSVRRDTGVVNLALPKSGLPFSVGKQNCSPCTGVGFVGVLDELAVYGKALPEARITAHFMAAK